MRRLLAVVSVAVLLLSGCGGGGGSAPGTGGISGFNSPSGIQQFRVQQAMVQQSLALITAQSTIGGYGGTGYVGIVLSARRGHPKARVKLTGTCYDGEIVSDTQVSPTVENETVELFYDSGCTEPESLGQFTITENSMTQVSLTGNVTLYDQSGAIDGYDTVSVSVNIPSSGSGTLVLQESSATSPTASPYVNIGAACSIAQNGNEGCSVAVDDHSSTLNADSAVAETVSISTTYSPPSISQTTTGNGTAYIGGLNATHVTQPSATTFAIAGGSAVDTASLSSTYSYSDSSAASATLTISDSANGGTVSVSYNPATQTFSGTLTQSSGGAPLATFTVDATGAGTITYSNGATGTINNGVITS